MRRKTAEFRRCIANGESTDSLLPEAYAVVCEANRRILGLEVYDCQILGGIALHYGYLAEMNTGEGKTLTATMPLYLNALTGKSTMLVTANDYLANRDAQEMGRVYKFLGMTVGSTEAMNEKNLLGNEEKRRIYDSDIVYTTHGTLGFDYLLNDLVSCAKDRFMREFYYVIIDEADMVLIDAATIPLVISGRPSCSVKPLRDGGLLCEHIAARAGLYRRGSERVAYGRGRRLCGTVFWNRKVLCSRKF